MSQVEKQSGEDVGDGRIRDSGMNEVDLQDNAGTDGATKIEVREKKGLLRSAIPQVKVPVAWIVLFLNVFLPGTGTVILSLFALCGVKTDFKKQNRCIAFIINLLTALLQMITAVIIVGWIWSVYWGMFTVTEANERSESKKNYKKAVKIQRAKETKGSKDNVAENAV